MLKVNKTTILIGVLAILAVALIITFVVLLTKDNTVEAADVQPALTTTTPIQTTTTPPATTTTTTPPETTTTTHITTTTAAITINTTTVTTTTTTATTTTAAITAAPVTNAPPAETTAARQSNTTSETPTDADGTTLGGTYYKWVGDKYYVWGRDILDITANPPLWSKWKWIEAEAPFEFNTAEWRKAWENLVVDTKYPTYGDGVANWGWSVRPDGVIITLDEKERLEGLFKETYEDGKRYKTWSAFLKAVGGYQGKTFASEQEWREVYEPLRKRQ